MDEAGSIYSKRWLLTQHIQEFLHVWPRPFADGFGTGLGASTAYSHNELEVQAKTSIVYQFEMLQTNLVNFSLLD